MPEEELDSRVRQLFEEYAAGVDCTTCANCCNEGPPPIDESDLERLASALGLTPAQFRRQYLAKNSEDGLFTFKPGPCPLLAGTRCSVYPVRPKDCASYPHLCKSGFVGRLSNVVANCGTCPVVFAVYERLKAEIWK